MTEIERAIAKARNLEDSNRCGAVAEDEFTASGWSQDSASFITFSCNTHKLVWDFVAANSKLLEYPVTAQSIKEPAFWALSKAAVDAKDALARAVNGE